MQFIIFNEKDRYKLISLVIKSLIIVLFIGLVLLAWRAARCGGSLRCSDCGGLQPQASVL
jgi:hypothetical protein